MSKFDAGNSYVTSIPQLRLKVDSTSEPALSDLSERDKPWDKHRGNADSVSSHYRGSKFQSYSTRIDFCSQLLNFRLVPDVEVGELKLKLDTAKFCRVRHCPVCQWRRSLMWKARAYKALPLVVEHYPKHRWLFLTLTVKNCPIADLRETLVWMNKAWQRFIQLKKFPAIGFIKSMEVTRGKDRSAHPHFHCLLLVKPGYFGGKNYLKQAEWVEMWGGSLRVDYKPVLHIAPVKQGRQPMELVPEILKYCVKESDLIVDREWFLELTTQLHKMKAVVVGGVLRDYLRQLENEPEDLIGKDETKTEDEVDEGHLYFGWKRREQKYRQVDFNNST